MVQFIESELLLLKNEIDEMWTLVYNQMDMACEAVLSWDKTLARQVIAREQRVNALELKIDSQVEDILGLYTPVAIDLRFVLAMQKINGDLERLGDFAESIAKFVVKCEEPVVDAELLARLKFSEMSSHVLLMLGTAKQALLGEDTLQAKDVLEEDNLLDAINAEAAPVLAEYIQRNPENALLGLNLIGVFRKLERSGDHITNIAEEIVFFNDAKVLKHSGKRN